MSFRLLMALLAGVTAALSVLAPCDAAWAETVKIPLPKLAPARSVDLKCIAAEQALQIPIPARWDVKRAVLSFEYVNSSALLAGTSRMAVKLNKTPISQINLNPLAPEGSVKLVIPGSAFQTGYNDLSFAVSQHYTRDCEQPCAADLWTTLKLDKAEMEIEYSLKPVPVKLSSVSDFLFDPRILPSGAVNLVLENRNADLVTIAGVVASGVARRFDYRKVLFTTSNDIKPGSDNIVIGRKGFVAGLLQAKGLTPPNIIGPFLKVLPLPASGPAPASADPNHALLVVSGATIDHLKLAASTLSIISPSFPNSDELVATGFRLADIPMYGGKQTVTYDRDYTFKNLDFTTVTLQGFNATARDIAFRLPADVLIKPNLYVDMSLYYAYGAALGPGSVINILLNGKHVRAIPLDNVKGDLIEGYKLRIPTYLFKPGDNYLRIEAAMIPLNNKSCENMLIDNLFLTIFDHSTLHFPQLPHFAELPNLELFMLNGFPLTRWPDGKGSTFYLADNDPATLDAALNLAGVISQKNGYPLFGTQFTYTDPKKFDGELIIVGNIAAIPEQYRQQAPLKLAGESTVPYPFTRNWNDDKTVAVSKQISALRPGKGALMEFLSPFTEGRTVVMMTAATPHDLETLSDALTESSVQAACTGDLALVDLENPEYKVDSLLVGKKYISGRSGDVSAVKRYLYYNPWLYYLAVALIIIALSLLLFYLLKQYRKRRLKGASNASNR